MQDLSNRNFGILIAHVLPGFIALWGLKAVSPTVQVWMSAAASSVSTPTVAGFLYITLASVAAGMTVGAIRWCIIDSLHHYTGLQRPQWDDAQLQANLAAAEQLIEYHYRYYQFYANSMISLVVVYAAHRWRYGFADYAGILEALLLALLIIFWATSRSTLYRYYTRTTSLLSHRQRQPQ